MGLAKIFSVLLAGTQLVEGHSSFVRIAVNGEWKQPFRFFRNKTEPYLEKPNVHIPDNRRFWHYPVYPEEDYPESSRCGRDNMAYAAETDVLQVKAGDDFEVAVTSQVPERDGWFPPNTVWDGCPEGRGLCRYDGFDNITSRIYHDGPLFAHLSKVPEGMDVREYDGTGKWVKIWTLGPEVRIGKTPLLIWPSNNWDNTRAPPRLRFSLPKQTPPGQYLLRLDSPWPGEGAKDPQTGELAVYKGVQLYPGCVQIEVESEATGSLPEGITIPEDLFSSKPGMWINRTTGYYGDLGPDWVYGGGPLWDGENYIQDKPPPMS